MPAATFLPERSGSRIGRTWTQITGTVPVARLVGICLLVVATCTVTSGLAAGDTKTLQPGVAPAVLFILTLLLLIVLGCWLVLYPSNGEHVMTVALMLGPIVFVAMVLTWADHGWIVSPIALLYLGACTAAFCSGRLLALQMALDIVAACVYLVQWFEYGSPMSSPYAGTFIANAGGAILAIVLFTLGVYILRHRVERIRGSLQARSLIDDLTGIPNRLHLQQVAAALTAGAIRHDREVYALLIDIDRLELVNSRYGVTVGDEIIRLVASAVRTTLRPEDVFIRLGGDQLLAAGVVRSQFEAVRVAERLRLNVRRTDLPVEVTCSIGVATARPTSGLDSIEWMWNLTAVAEESLAAAKASGRDRVAPARQSGDVLGDALAVVTSRAGAPVIQFKEPHGRSPDLWASPITISRSVAVLGGLGISLLYVLFRDAGNQLSIWVVFGSCLVLCGSLVFLVLRPTRIGSALIIAVLAADVAWAAAAVQPNVGSSLGLPASIMGVIAAWLLSRRAFALQMIVTIPVTFVVLLYSGLQRDEALVTAVVQGGAVIVACVGLYLLRQHGEELIRQSEATLTSDPITGLPNRRLLAERAPAIVGGAARLGAAVSVTVLDIDEFWRINEHQGIPGGDKVLAEVGRVLYRTTRIEDLLVRLSGDDFVIVALGDPDEARRFADRAAEAINGIWAFGAPLRCTVGFAVGYPEQRLDAMVWLMSLVDASWASLRQTRAERAEAEAEQAAEAAAL